MGARCPHPNLRETYNTREDDELRLQNGLEVDVYARAVELPQDYVDKENTNPSLEELTLPHGTWFQ